MDGSKVLKPGDHVIFVDEQRIPHNALIEVWHVGTGNTKLAETLGEFRDQLRPQNLSYIDNLVPCVNLVFVLQAKDRRDQYGNQKDHRSSCMNGDQQTPPRIGCYWLWPEQFDGKVGEYYPGGYKG